ncbi:GNAT family N-acetyltransferase [Termitidicoccus mucosus]|uniref:Phosphinothricin acetyltransferase n=1 Tax=Termitidicoccus mucosus TaxID=1184151 RepID=A0A178IN91_9BACT|nr:phosphinothricin acetyltransferase [Opitutaceae bacterium TSB47]
MSPSVRLRLAAESDLPAIVGIFNSTIPGHMVTAHTRPVTVAERLPWFREHNPQTRPLWVAEQTGGGEGQGSAVVAWAGLSLFSERPAYYPTAEVSIYIEENHRRRGLGRWLLREIIARAPACKVTTLVGLIWAHNQPSLALFASEGFERWGHLPRVAELAGIERDLVIVGRRVD